MGVINADMYYNLTIYIFDLHINCYIFKINSVNKGILLYRGIPGNFSLKG